MTSARGAVIAAVIGVVVVVSVALSWRLYDYVLDLRTAPRDNVQWTLAQLEVDLLNLTTAVLTTDETGDLAPLRRRYDIFYSRVGLIARGQVFAAVRGEPRIAEQLQSVERFLAETTPLVDGPDWLLRAELPALAVRLADQRQVAREMSIGAVRIFADHSDVRRQRFEELLVLTAAVVLALIVLLVLALVFLAREHRTSVDRGVAAARSRERLAAAIDVALEAIVVVDDRGRIIEFNPSAEAVFGYARREAIGMQMGRLLVPDGPRGADRDGWRDILDGRGRAVGQGRLETFGRREDGAAFPAELSIGAASDESGPIFIAYVRDISERLAAERAIVDARDRALAADRAKSDFIAVISHEMRTPLNGLLGVLDLMAETELSPRQSRYLGMAVTSSEILLRHVNDVLDIARIESGKLTLDLAPLDIRALVADVVEVTRPAAAARGARIRV
ncbi:MAG: PAS domain S-box protein, partial [Alphaproteobacteria bacterium]